jgi:hypothetical protein
MFRRTPGASAGDSNPDTRPLRPRPSLEYERKQAKMLLRQLRAGDPDAFARARARHAGLRSSSGSDIALAHARLVVAREYGFASWLRLVQYFGAVERQRMARRSSRPLDREFYELPRDGETQYFDAHVAALLGEPDRALQFLGTAIERGSTWDVVETSDATPSIDPDFAPLRGLPKFKRIVALW